jgi:hypothetical protein
MVSGDFFTCPRTRMTLRKPPRWHWLPGPWMNPERDSVRAATAEGLAMLLSAQAPIVCLTRPHGSRRHLDPTVQLFRRPIAGEGALDDLATSLRTTLPKMFHKCRFGEVTTDAILAGHRALRYLVDYTLLSEPGIAYRCRCLGHFILHGRYGLTLTMSGSTAQRYRFEDDLQLILSSVTFQRASRRRPADHAD